MIKHLELDNGCICDVEDNGNIYSRYGRLLSHAVDKVGYHSVFLRGNDGKQHRFLVHRLVAMAFINKNIQRKDHVHHIDKDRGNNNLKNLHVIEMEKHQRLHKQILPYQKQCKVCGNLFTPNPTKRRRAVVCSEECQKIIHALNIEKQKRKIDQISKEDGSLIKVWESGTKIQEELGYNHPNIHKCCNGQIQSAYGFIWRYHEE